MGRASVSPVLGFGYVFAEEELKLCDEEESCEEEDDIGAAGVTLPDAGEALPVPCAVVAVTVNV